MAMKCLTKEKHWRNIKGISDKTTTQDKCKDA